jgi:hypothetical protein
MSRGTFVLLLALSLVGCSGSTLAPALSAPTSRPVPQPSPQPAIELVVFNDRASGFSTSDVRDAQEQIVSFNTSDELIWTADGRRFPEYIVDGTFIAYHHKADRFFQVRFGTKGGERRAYLTSTDDRLSGMPATVLDLSVDGRGTLIITETNLPVPGT